VDQFRLLIEDMKPESKLIYFSGDKVVADLVSGYEKQLELIPTKLPDYMINNGQTYVLFKNHEFPITVFGEHNLQNLAGAQKICELLGITQIDFWNLVSDFKGAGKRLEKVENKGGILIFRDFAHAPSKVKGSTEAVAAQFNGKNIVAILELHTFSSLNKSFIPQYAGTLDSAGKAYVYIDAEALKTKGADIITEQEIKEAFNREDIIFLQEKEELKAVFGQNLSMENVILLMSSGNLGGLDLKKELA
jgi:UDP-N-acetylmuramate: L-alanyl-gamma-D-glutamyl-meso-diaminopimelate ligase